MDASAGESAGQEVRARYVPGWVIVLVLLIVVTLENFLANTFYKEAPQARPVGAAA